MGDENRYPRAPDTPLEFQTACSGWIATYEIFSILDFRTKSISLTTIHLKPYNIELCLRQCLRFSPLARGSWKCSFPLTISPGLGHLTILNTIYNVQDHPKICSGVDLPINLTPRVEKSWLPGWKRVLSYCYELCWSPNSKYLAFSDLERNTSTKGNDALGIEIFYVARVGGFANRDQPPTLINSTFLPEPQCNYIGNCHFHPTDPLFIFVVDNQIFIWEFEGKYLKPVDYG